MDNATGAAAPPPASSTLAFRTTMDFTYGEARELQPGVARIVANNPGPFTFKGTNTYILGTESLAVIDPGPEDPDHLAGIMAYAAGRPITHILITHTHRDHVDGLRDLLSATDATVCGFGRAQLEQDPRLRSLTGRSFIDVDFEPDVALRDGDTVRGPDWSVEALHTPGHAPDHLCFDWADMAVVFSGDHVMGWNTTVVAPPEGHMGDYMASLQKLADRATTVFYPGHGGQIGEPRKVAKAYMVHRRMREQAIHDAIKKGHATVSTIVDLVYKGLDPTLINAARMSVLAHVEHLQERQQIEAAADGPLDFETKLIATKPPA
ncbi:MAG: MBL fold metallo-hydrolase [Pseudomonadota bacterium]